MGIAGLTPFLLKHFPHVVKEIPDRFLAFAGKTIAIDGTLVTQRFWFSPDPHQYRHVKGWHRLISELQRCDIRVVAIFDGKFRHDAKQREIARRQSARELLIRRAKAESERGKRLERIGKLVSEFGSLGMDDTSKTEAVSRLEDLVSLASVSIPSFSFDSGSQKFSKDGSLSDPTGNGVSPQPPQLDLAVPSFDALDEQELLAQFHPLDAKPPHIPDAMGITPARAEASTSFLLVHSPETLSRRLAALYRDFQRTLRQESWVTSISASPLPNFTEETPESGFEQLNSSRKGSAVVDSELEIPDADPEALNDDVVLSKLQANLVHEEARVWSSIIDLPCTSLSSANQDLTKRLQDLQEASLDLLQSYTKRYTIPNSKTYDESRLLLEAMGVLVLEAPFPYEAEAVAASLCLHGLADAVGSEDTDVLIYEAPLLRNLTSRELPLVQISGKDVRAALNLSRSSFVDFALLLGSDFSQRLHGVGPSRAIKLIQAEGSIEGVLRSERAKSKGKRYIPEPRISEVAYMEQVRAGRSVFESLPPVGEDIRAAVLKYSCRELDEAAVVDLLRSFDLSKEVWKIDGPSGALHQDFYAQVPNTLSPPMDGLLDSNSYYYT